jgi:outer membrane protein insertion porin family
MKTADPDRRRWASKKRKRRRIILPEINGNGWPLRRERGIRDSRCQPILTGLFFFFLLQAIVWVGRVQAQEIVRVGVLPFRVYAGEPDKLASWPEKITQTLSAELGKDERITLVRDDEVKKAMAPGFPEEVNDQWVREIGRELGADFMISGSVTQIDGSISLDARIIDVHRAGVFYSGFAVAKGREDLDTAVGKLGQEAKIKILKKEIVSKILIEGNRFIEENAIRSQIKMKEGEIFSPAIVREDVKAVYQLGYFQDVRVEKRDWGRGVAIVFVVEEKSVVKEIKFSGNKALKNDELLEVISLKPRTILDLNLVKESINKIQKKYREEAYFLAEVHYELETPKKGEVIVRFVIQENKKIRIQKITFTGNAHFADEKLKKVLPETKEKNFFSWATKSGIYKEDILERDLDGILVFYYQRGFYQVKVGKPQVTYDQEGIQITIPVEEGRQFKVGKLDIQGDLIAPKEDLFKKVNIYEGEILNRDKVRDTVSVLTDLYADQGYAFVDVSPQVVIHAENNMADLTIAIHKGSKVYLERINILGNTKTRDKVIRRELQAEGELYSLSALKRSRERLNFLGFFKEVSLNTKKGSADDKLDMSVQVEEGPTGSFSVGGGYSTVDKLMASVQIAQNNLFGRGQRLSASGTFGAVSQYFNLGFTEPRLFDTQISAGADLYRTNYDYDEYSVRKTGTGVRFGFPLFEEVRGFSSYKYEHQDVYNIKPNASSTITEQEGVSITSSVSGALRRDTRDHNFDPSKGSDSLLSMEYAGGFLGGTNFFTKYRASSRVYFTPWWKLTLMGHGRIGYIQAREDHLIPLAERFILGGINSVRGFKAYTIGPKDENGVVIGGDKELLFNLEAIFPLIPSLKIKGVVFFDAGNAFDVGEPYDLGKLRTSAGFEIRWISPVGPLRVAWGYNINPEEGEEQWNWDFSVGTLF